jgi:hypothetical protein
VGPSARPDGTLDDYARIALEEQLDTAEVLAQSELVGLEVGDLESTPDHDSPGYVSDRLHALDPLLRVSNR